MKSRIQNSYISTVQQKFQSNFETSIQRSFSAVTFRWANFPATISLQLHITVKRGCPSAYFSFCSKPVFIRHKKGCWRMGPVSSKSFNFHNRSANFVPSPSLACAWNEHNFSYTPLSIAHCHLDSPARVSRFPTFQSPQCTLEWFKKFSANANRCRKQARGKKCIPYRAPIQRSTGCICFGHISGDWVSLGNCRVVGVSVWNICFISILIQYGVGKRGGSENP